jgi:hypothetical protein
MFKGRNTDTEFLRAEEGIATKAAAHVQGLNSR